VTTPVNHCVGSNPIESHLKFVPYDVFSIVVPITSERLS